MLLISVQNQVISYFKISVASISSQFNATNKNSISTIFVQKKSTHQPSTYLIIHWSLLFIRNKIIFIDANKNSKDTRCVKETKKFKKTGKHATKFILILIACFPVFLNFSISLTHFVSFIFKSLCSPGTDV